MHNPELRILTKATEKKISGKRGVKTVSREANVEAENLVNKE
jgi:hypothetical protein